MHSSYGLQPLDNGIFNVIKDTEPSSTALRKYAENEPASEGYSQTPKSTDQAEVQRKRKAVPNPNQRLMTLAEALATRETLQDTKEAEIEVDVDEKVESVIEVGIGPEDEREDFTVVIKHYQRTRSGQEIKKPRRE
ncbi:hypothetical protein FOXB_01239 [Fusarium oxysporum f. sp. conglutinans Fo5176]|uniref:Uncharacterized protein n=1 Tax=Fusarium oxysporum (strain Fo5176) TaxID=660025 RepID=F9F4B4_FUSOF|nr:hypothetical protein FOXB_01239 [Fusarium oxysporum f. sp. conglutinans Fo5176]